MTYTRTTNASRRAAKAPTRYFFEGTGTFNAGRNAAKRKARAQVRGWLTAKRP